MKGFIVLVAFIMLVLIINNPSCSAEVPMFETEQVIFNQSSKTYHKPECRWAKNCTVNCVQIPLSEALNLGGKPCKTCLEEPLEVQANIDIVPASLQPAQDERPPQEILQSKTGNKEGSITPEECIQTFCQPIKLSSKCLRNNFSAYKCTVLNACDKTMRILNIDIINGYKGSDAYKMVKKESTNSYIVWGEWRSFLTRRKNRKAREESVDYKNNFRRRVLNPGDWIESRTLVPLKEEPQIELLIKEYDVDGIYSISR
jgi:hypothetical protein